MNSSTARAVVAKYDLQDAVAAVVDEAPPWSLTPEPARDLWRRAKASVPSEAS